MNSNSTFPSLVVIIRHGEKPGNPANDDKGGMNLSILGSARAAALPSLFTPNPVTTPVTTLMQPSCGVAQGQSAQFTGTYSSSGLTVGPPLLPVPNFLFATKQSSNSNRPYETIVPLSQALPGAPISIDNSYSDKHYADLAAEILTTNPAKYANQVVLICWHHGKIPELAEAFKVPKPEMKNYDPWPATVFDIIFQITWTNGQAALAIGYQKLLFGDSASEKNLQS